MKLVREDWKTGTVTVIPQDSDDLYTLYNILALGDRVSQKTSRKLKLETSGKTERISAIIEILLKEIEFHGFGEIIRLKGIITAVSDEQISIGSHHTLKAEIRKPIKIIKTVWNRVDRNLLEKSRFGSSSGIAILVIDDESAVVALVGNHASKILLDVKPTITRKGSDPNQYRQSRDEFYDQIIRFTKDSVNEGVIETLIVCGPGFTHDHIFSMIKQDIPSISTKVSNFAINNSGRSGVTELLTYHLPDNFLADNNARLQAELLQNVLEHLGKDTGMIVYGKNISKAINMAAVEHLLVLDTLLRSSVDVRKDIESKIENVMNIGGKYTVISSMLDTGKILEGFGGVIAILRFQMK